MASQGNYQPPPLDDILRTLSQYSSPLPYQAVQPQSAEPRTPEVQTSFAADLRTRPRSTTPSQLTRPKKSAPSVDPSTITAWPQALKYVMSSLSQSPSASATIKKLIHTQNQHEKQWWDGRQNLITKLKGRGEGRKRADDLLRSLGAASKREEASLPSETDIEIEDKELEVYDGKVYGALSEMSREMDRELRALRVPFFAIKHELVDLKSEHPSSSNVSALSKKELLGLQKRMLQVLQDLFGE